MDNLLLNPISTHHNSVPASEMSGKVKNEAMIKNLEGIVSNGLKDEKQKVGFLEKLKKATEVVPEKKIEEDEKIMESMAFLTMFPVANLVLNEEVPQCETINSEKELGVLSIDEALPLHDMNKTGGIAFQEIDTIQKLEEKVAEEVRRIASLEVPQQMEESVEATQIVKFLQKASESSDMTEATQISAFIQKVIENNGVTVEMKESIETFVAPLAEVSTEALKTAVHEVSTVKVKSDIEADTDMVKTIAPETAADPSRKIVVEKPKEVEAAIYQQPSKEDQLSANLKMLQAIYNTEFIDRTIGTTASIVQNYFDLINSRIIDSLRFALQNNMQTISIDLTPGTLGRVNISISTGSSGVEASISVSSKMTNDILSQNIGELHSAIKSHGVQLKSLDIHVSQQHNETQHEQSRQQPESQPREERKYRHQSEAQINYQNILKSFLEEDLSNG